MSDPNYPNDPTSSDPYAPRPESADPYATGSGTGSSAGQIPPPPPLPDHDTPAPAPSYGSTPPPPPGYASDAGYGGQGGYGQMPPPPPVGAYGQPAGSPPPNYLVWAILSTLFCCLPLGVASIVFAAQVNSKWAMGDHAGAQESSAKAKKFAVWSAIAWAVGIVLYLGFAVATGVFTSTTTVTTR